MPIVPELNMNRHPKDCKDYSLVDALNIKLSNDFSCLQNENAIINHEILNSIIDNNELLGIITCNKELILFVNITVDDIKQTHLFRYNEDLNECLDCGVFVTDMDSLNPYSFENEIIGTFTYNINNDLLLAFTERNTNNILLNENNTLKTINIGDWDNFDRSDIIIDEEGNKYINIQKLSLCPEVNLPSIENVESVKGSALKGWYHIFIRYKINKIDYTQWYHIGYPLLVDSLVKQNIIKYKQRYKAFNLDIKPEHEIIGTGASDYFSNNLDISKDSVQFLLNNLDTRYNEFQLGFICITTNYQKGFITSDIKINNNIFTLDNKSLKEFTYTDFIVSNYNYYNVENLINYKNRLYIANYKESIKPKSEIKSIVDNIKLDLNIIEKQDNSLRYIVNKLGEEGSNPEGDYSFIIEKDTPLRTSNSVLHKNIEFDDIHTVFILDNNNNKKTPVSVYAISEVAPTYSYGVKFVFNDKEYTYVVEGIKNRISRKFQVVSIQNPFTEDVIIKDAISSDSLIPYIDTNHTFEKRKYEYTLIPNGIYNFYIHFVDKYGISTEGFKLNNVVEGSLLETITNINGDILFKIPDDIISYHDDLYNYKIYQLKVKVDEIPDGYIGYYFSYEKYENKSITGILCIDDITDVNTEHVIEKDKKLGDKKYMQFFSADLDNDSVSLNYNKIRILGKSVLQRFTDINVLQVNYESKYFTNLNLPENQTYNLIDKTYDIQNLSYKIGGDAKGGRYGLGTCFEMDIIDELFEEPNSHYDIYKAIIFNDDNILYTKEDKELIRFSNTYYTTDEIIIKEGYNGHLTFNNFIVYNSFGLLFDAYKRLQFANTTKEIIDEEESELKVIQTPYYFFTISNKAVFTIDTKILAYIQFPIINDKLYEVKEFNKEPETELYILSSIENEEETITQPGVFVRPEDSIKLFKNRFNSQDYLYPIGYMNYNEDSYQLNEFNKTIRRSAILSDESSFNSWRNFPVEAYKQISENKGKITNLVGIGNTLLVHTEHSLFAFVADSTIKTQEDRTIRLENPDVFDIDYTEILTSKLGVCGLQDKDAYIVDDFGYIFYDNDEHKLFKYGANKLDEIGTSIVQFLNKYKPNKIRFGADKESNRVLLTISFNDIIDTKLTLSYNYKTNTFISSHDYNFIKSYSTKTKDYYLIDNVLKTFNYNNKENTNYANNCKLSFICNTEYTIIKCLEFITYKLYKCEVTNVKYELFPVEGDNGHRKHPFAGDNFRVFNDLTDTNKLDISLPENITNIENDNYKKPYFDLGNWNYSYLRDIKDEMSRLHGNYFVISFTFNNTNGQRIEFEDLKCAINKFK